ncbi:MAG: hypothetical protein EOO82_00465 [Oxalobacteraceae bacterium]|nr:MAG: hypothetical protein EOO82_00465 [Oxalobacteraceae bacterium]
MTAGLTGIDHADNPAIGEAAAWLAAQTEPHRPLVPALRQRFGLSALEACEAAARAQDFGCEAGDGAGQA